MSDDEHKCAKCCFAERARLRVCVLVLTVLAYLRDTLRILVATDNHLVCDQGTSAKRGLADEHSELIVVQGVWEKDEFRKDDSFIAFEEILKLAQKEEVDLVLLGGDLFHDNKPSRSTIVRAIDILTRYTLSDKPVKFQVLSNQAQNFASG